LIIFATQSSCDDIVKHVLYTFKGRDLGAASWVLGMSIKRDTSNKVIELSQERMIESALARFVQENARLSWIPLDANDGPVLDRY
jgi:hypothetical protein